MRECFEISPAAEPGSHARADRLRCLLACSGQPAALKKVAASEAMFPDREELPGILWCWENQDDFGNLQ